MSRLTSSRAPDRGVRSAVVSLASWVLVVALAGIEPWIAPSPAFHVVEVVAILAAYTVTVASALQETITGRASAFLSVGILKLGFVLLAFALLHSQLGLVGPDDRVTHRFADAAYFSVVTFTTVGYGDFQPVPEGRFAAASEALIGYISLGLFIMSLGHRSAADAADRRTA